MLIEEMLRQKQKHVESLHYAVNIIVNAAVSIFLVVVLPAATSARVLLQRGRLMRY